MLRLHLVFFLSCLICLLFRLTIFSYIHDAKYTIKIVTKDIIFSGEWEKKYYTFFFPSSSFYSDVDCVSALRKCDGVMKDVPLYILGTLRKLKVKHPRLVQR